MIANQENTAQQVKVKRAGEGTDTLLDEGMANVHKTFTLTRVQQKVMDVITSTKYRTETNEVKAKAIGISERRLYQVMADPHFAEARRNLLQYKIQAQADSFVSAAAQTARIIGREGDNARRLLLGMSGDYVERRQQDVTVNGQMLVGVVNVSLDQL